MVDVVIPGRFPVENILEKVDGVDINSGAYPRNDADPEIRPDQQRI